MFECLSCKFVEMRENASDKLFRLGTGDERTTVALEREVAKIPLAYDVLDRLTARKAFDAAPHRLKTFLGDLALEMRGKCAAPRLEESRGEKLGRHLCIRNGLRLKIGARLGNCLTPSHGTPCLLRTQVLTSGRTLARLLYDLTMRFAQHRRIVLEDLAIVCQKSVDLGLDVGRLGVDRTAKSLLCKISHMR